jgi:DnaJ-class molecular chaperone
VTRAPRMTLLATLASTLLLSGCHASIGNPAPTRSTTTTSTNAQPTVPKGDLEQITGQQVREQSGGGPVVITCPGDLPIHLGASEQCVLAQDGKHFAITIKITKVKSTNDASWDWQVGQQLSPTS